MKTDLQNEISNSKN